MTVVTRAFFNRKIEEQRLRVKHLQRQNTKLLNYFAQLHHNQKHYLEITREKRKAGMRYRKALLNLLSWKTQIKNKIGQLRLWGHTVKGGPRRYLFSVTRAEYQKLRHFLGRDERKKNK